MKKIFHISGMHCVSCGMNIDGELEDTKGVHSATTSYAKGMCVVEFDENIVGEEQLQQTVERLGYHISILENK